MIEKLKKRLKGVILLLVGIGLLFVGAAGTFDLLQRNQGSEYVGQEVPRDMIEAGFSAAQNAPGGAAEPEGEGFEPFFIPADSKLAQALPTLEPASVAELSLLAQTRTPESAEELNESIDDILDAIPVQPTPDGTQQGVIPLWIHIDVIALDAPIIQAVSSVVEVESEGKLQEYVQWEAPDQAAVGWHTNSARLGVVGNTVLNGHHNAFGRVFRNLAYVQEGDYVQVYGSDAKWYTYLVAKKMVLPEWNVTLEKRLENAAWILPSQDERLTLITCWPEQSNSHRLIIVARPVSVE